MENLMAVGIGTLVACGVFLILRARTFPVILGLTLLSYAVNLFLVSMGRLQGGAPPIVVEGTERYVDPLPQALVLTAIVIGFGMTAFIVVLSLGARFATGSDHVDGLPVLMGDHDSDSADGAVTPPGNQSGVVMNQASSPARDADGAEGEVR
ncbi:MAG TPA: Na+/H+ antiporter subunit C [Gemmatimonadales bacterium]|nr:Na+/H+ antiporter subunit C [Gemmatimonadales bacterium]